HWFSWAAFTFVSILRISFRHAKYSLRFTSTSSKAAFSPCRYMLSRSDRNTSRRSRFGSAVNVVRNFATPEFFLGNGPPISQTMVNLLLHRLDLTESDAYAMPAALKDASSSNILGAWPRLVQRRRNPSRELGPEGACKEIPYKPY